MIICHLYEPKPFKNFQNCVLYMCKKQRTTAVERVRQMSTAPLEKRSEKKVRPLPFVE